MHSIFIEKQINWKEFQKKKKKNKEISQTPYW
jgi:hypothetical protein